MAYSSLCLLERLHKMDSVRWATDNAALLNWAVLAFAALGTLTQYLLHRRRQRKEAEAAEAEKKEQRRRKRNESALPKPKRNARAKCRGKAKPKQKPKNWWANGRSNSYAKRGERRPQDRTGRTHSCPQRNYPTCSR